jgi:DNA helicase-2/ATP-dependent DNA helicase PcrA
MATDLSHLNEQQRTAVLESIDHNVVLLAAAGSGKTATLVKRTEYLIQEHNVNPENIMLITFTNKAAKEIVSRIAQVTPEAGKMWIGTFHHICTRLLRKFGNVMGITNFSIIDTKETTKILTEIYTNDYGEVDKGTIRKYRKKISYYKSNLVNPASVLQKCDEGTESYRFAGIYQEYQNRCWRNKTFDFDDLIIYAILLLNSYQQVKQWVSENIKYVMIDETQDTGTDQYTLIRLLVGDNNIMAVGDVNQSIYGFRNAKPEYLNQFTTLFPNTKLLKLETNYRSTNTIISAANAVINNNTFGEKIDMVSVNEMGAKIGLKPISRYFPNQEEAEASWVCSEIQALVNNGKNYGDFAIINRTNVQNKDIEKTFIKTGIPYVIVGSSSFWSSTEVRDLLAYCKVVFNP